MVFPVLATPTLTYVILPSGVNGTDNSEVMAYACPAVIDANDPTIVVEEGFVDFYAPVPRITNTSNRLSSVEPLQPGQFEWALSGLGVVEAKFNGQIYAKSEVIRLSSPNDVSGQVFRDDQVTFTVSGRITDGPTDVVTDGETAGKYVEQSFQVSRVVVDPSYSQGDGTIQNPYLIYNQFDLEKVRCHKSKHFALANDISLTGKWLSIGAPNFGWEGSLDGRGHSISGLDVGYPGQDFAGLFGEVETAAFKNLTIMSPQVTGGRYVAALFGRADRTVSVENVTITDASITGNEGVGILGGSKDAGGLIQKTSVSGVVNAHPIVTRWNRHEYMTAIDRPSAIGGMLGEDSGDGSTHINNQVEVEINVTPEVNFPLRASETVPRVLLDGTRESGARRIGGYVGQTEDEGTFNSLKIDSTINIVAFGNGAPDSPGVEKIGGVVGYNETNWTQIESDSAIKIVALAEMTIREIGGVIGYNDDEGTNRTNSNSNIFIESGNAENNSLGLSYHGAGVIVEEVGGVGGEYDDYSLDAYVRAHADITIRNVGEIEYVAGYLGFFDHDSGVGYSDNFVSGSISLNAISEIISVGGYVNLNGGNSNPNNANGVINGTRLFAAVTLITSGSATVSRVGPFVGTGDTYRPEGQLAFNSFWDSTLNSASNPEGHPGQPASSAELKSKAFLTAQGMDFQNVWDINSGSYPTLKPGVYKWGSSGSSFGGGGSGGSMGAPNLALSGPSKIVIPKAVKQGKQVIVKGQQLNRVTQVFVGGKKVSYTIRTNGNLTFKAPELSPKKHKVKLVSETAGTIFEKKMRIVSR